MNNTESFSRDLLGLLQKKQLISEQEAQTIRRRMQRGNISDIQAISELAIIPEREAFIALSELTGYPLLEEKEITPTEEAKKIVSTRVALHYKFIPISLKNGTLEAVFSIPPTINSLENLRLLLGVQIKPLLATTNTVNRMLKEIYGLGAGSVLEMREKIQEKKQRQKTITIETGSNISDSDDSAPIINLVNQILIEALEMHATDIHIEPFHETLKVRYRIDGMLRDIPIPDGIHGLQEAIISRIKIMADLNIAERRLPHDGRIRVNLEKESFDLRVSIIPTRFGETICLRVLNRSSIFLTMPKLGLGEHEANILSKLIALPHGIILVTGPTGSGKTTTLYAALSRILEKNPERKIITIEDPVEYELEGTSQIQVKPDIGLTFAAGLRSILRHDPDIILIGEIRDEETAEIAIRAALTGHLVFSTLHTNDSTSSINRLIDMNVEPFLVSSSLVACLAQRLVRRICPYCKQEVTNIPNGVRKEMAKSLNIPIEEVRAWEGKGCSDCSYIGYNKRIAIYEFFLLDEEIHDMVSEHAKTSDLRKTAIRNGMKTLRDSGWAQVLAGTTTIEEVSRITGNFQVSYDMGNSPLDE